MTRSKNINNMTNMVQKDTSDTKNVLLKEGSMLKVLKSQSNVARVVGLNLNTCYVLKPNDNKELVIFTDKAMIPLVDKDGQLTAYSEIFTLIKNPLSKGIHN